MESANDYAKQHVVMLMIVLVFFGILIVPRLYKQARRHAKISGIVKTIYFSKDAPATSFVEITYKVKGKEYTARELLDQRIQVGDHVEVYVDNDTNTIQFEQVSTTQNILLMIAYVGIIVFSIYTLYVAYVDKKK